MGENTENELDAGMVQWLGGARRGLRFRGWSLGLRVYG